MYNPQNDSDFTTAECCTGRAPSKEAVILVRRAAERVSSFKFLSLHVGGPKNTIHHNHKLRCYYLSTFNAQW
jgi:hypothetical protein